MVGPDLPLISFRSILKQETQTGRLRPPRHPPFPHQTPSFHFYFGLHVQQCKPCVKEKKERKMKVNMKSVRVNAGEPSSILTGGAQLANHRGSRDAAVASAVFEQSGKLTARPASCSSEAQVGCSAGRCTSSHVSVFPINTLMEISGVEENGIEGLE